MVILNKFTFDVTFPYDYSVYNIASQKSNMYDKTSSKNTMNTVLIRYDNVNRRQPLSSIHAYIYLVQVALNCILTVASYICHFIHSKREKIKIDELRTIAAIQNRDILYQIGPQLQSWIESFEKLENVEPIEIYFECSGIDIYNPHTKLGMIEIQLPIA